MSEPQFEKPKTANRLAQSTPTKRSHSGTAALRKSAAHKLPLGLKAPAASRDAKQIAAAVLEVLAGVRSPADAAVSLGVSLPRYYQLEGRAFQGLVAACEPLPRGRVSTAEQQVRSLGKQLERLKREHARQQALVRAAQRTIGLSLPEKPASLNKAQPNSKPKRVRRPTARALKAVRSLRSDSAAVPADSAGPADPAAQAAEHAAQSAASPQPVGTLQHSESLEVDAR